MAYVILHRDPKARGSAAAWKAVPRLATSEHEARDRQRNVERANPGIETRRDWIEI